MAYNIGLNVIEVDGSASPAIVGAATSVAGLVLDTARGPVNTPTRISSFPDFVARFGGFDPSSVAAFVVKGFFDNGGSIAWVTRVASAPRTASLQLRTGAGNNARDTLRFAAGNRGQDHPGAWANGLGVDVTASAETTLGAANPAVTQTGAVVASVAGFSRDDVAIVTDDTRSRLVTITAIDPDSRQLSWDALPNFADFDVAKTRVRSSDFDITIRASGTGEVLETWTRLTLRRDAPNYAVTRLNDGRSGSRWVTATDERGADQLGAGNVGRAEPMALAGGSTTAPTALDYAGTDTVTKTGMRAFDPLDVQLVATDSSDATVIRSGLDYCESRGDAMFVGSVPQGSIGDGSASGFTANLRGKKVYGALYGPWISVLDPLATTAPTRSVPPTGHILGVFARTETIRGIHKAPAGDEARLLGALDVEYRLSDVDHSSLVRDAGINGIRAIPGAGIVIDASRTLSTDTRWLYVNVRLLFNYVKSSLRHGLRWVRQEPNRDTLWNAVNFGTVRPFLMGLWRQGAFGTGDPDDVFTIVCDASNNPPDEVDNGNFHLDVTFYPSRPAETIVISVGQQPSGASAGES